MIRRPEYNVSLSQSLGIRHGWGSWVSPQLWQEPQLWHREGRLSLEFPWIWYAGSQTIITSHIHPQPDLVSQLHHLLTVRPWGGHFSSLNLLPLCRMGLSGRKNFPLPFKFFSLD